MELKWKKEPGSAVQAPISHGGDAHDYVISHRRDQHTVSYNPPGKHEHVGTFATEKEALAAAEAHEPSRSSPAPASASKMPATRRKESRAMPRKKSAKQLDREIASNLSARGQPQLADLFADPAARQTFAKELRHERQTQQTSRVTAEAKAARPFTVKRMETTTFIDGDRRVRSLVGRFATESEARAVADRVDGWVETRDGKVIYGREAHATKKASPRPTPYRLKLTPSEMRAVEHARGRYAWPDMLAAHAAEDGSVAFTESEMWQWTDDVDSDAAGGHSPFPLAAGAFAEKLQSFYDERI